MMSAQEALTSLREGNRRFVQSLDDELRRPLTPRRHELLTDQEPSAIILGCSDARVPAEIVFDQGLGDLFVIRVAGNIVAPSQIGSVEFAAERFGTRLVVVLGHSNCGAILATIESMNSDEPMHSHNLPSIVDRIRPVVETLAETDLKHDHEALVRYAVRANIRGAVNNLKQGSRILERLVQQGGLLVVGAEYSLDTGEVKFLDLPLSE